MTTHSSVAALVQRPSLPSIHKRAIPSENENRLHRIATGQVSVTDAYRNVDLPWMDLVDDEQVYDFIAGKAFQDFVRIAEICA